MQVTVERLFKSDYDEAPVIIDTNCHATVQTLISAYCTQKGMPYSAKFCVYDESRNALPLYQTLQVAGVSGGQKLYIGYKENNTWKTRWGLFLAALALILGVTGIITMSLLYSLHGGKIPFDHGVVMDAGSTKTQPILYKWEGNKFRGTGCVKQTADCKVKGGIAKSKNVDLTIDKIIDCTKKMTSTINEKRRPNTTVYFTATAGMRLLEISDPTQEEFILSRLRQRLNETGLTVMDVTVITGSEEGMYGWITVNFLKNSLETELPEPWAPVTYGALDLGGASTQVAFSVPPTDENVNKSVKLTLFGQDHYVYAKSYLCFGRDEAQKRYRSLLIKDPRVLTVDDPCAPKGWTVSFNGTYIFKETCTESDYFNKWIRDIPDIENFNYEFSGTSNYKQCLETVVKLLDPVDCHNKNFYDCFHKLPRQLENQKFVAFAAFYYTTDFLNVTKSSLAEFMNVTQSFCARSIDEIYGEEDHKAEYCFNAVYIHELLINGYGLNESTWSNLEFQKKIDNKSLGWTLGYMINATNAIPSKKPTRKIIGPNVLIVCLLLFILVVAATIVYISHYCVTSMKERNRKWSRRSSNQLT